jgi:hypothetical protein
LILVVLPALGKERQSLACFAHVFRSLWLK